MVLDARIYYAMIFAVAFGVRSFGHALSDIDLCLSVGDPCGRYLRCLNGFQMLVWLSQG